MLAADCSLSLTVVSQAAQEDPNDAALLILKDVVENFHLRASTPEEVLMCSLNMLGGKGDKTDCYDVMANCTTIGTDSVPHDHMFGAYYGFQ